MSRSGGLRTSWRRSSAGVSPVRMPTVGIRTGWPRRSPARRDALQRRPQVLLDVDGQRPQRGDVEDPRPRRLRRRRVHQPVDPPQEGGEGLARPGRGQDQRVVPGGDGRPPLLLGRRRGAEGRLEPRPDRLGEPLQHHDRTVPRRCDRDIRLASLRSASPAPPKLPDVVGCSAPTPQPHDRSDPDDRGPLGCGRGRVPDPRVPPGVRGVLRGHLRAAGGRRRRHPGPHRRAAGGLPARPCPR